MSKRNIPDSYFKGYRRLAPAKEDIKGEHCWNCQHAVCFHSWHCDLPREICEWEQCYLETEISKADLKAGHNASSIGRWVSLPKQEVEN